MKIKNDVSRFTFEKIEIEAFTEYRHLCAVSKYISNGIVGKCIVISCSEKKHTFQNILRRM